MSNALTTMDFGSTQTRKTDLTKFAPGGGRFLRRIQINDNNTYTKRGLISPGNIGIPVSKDKIIDLGESVDLLLFAVRDKCLDMNYGDKPLAVYDTTHEEFVRIFWEVYDRDKYLEDGGELDDNGLRSSEGVQLKPIKGLNGFLHGPSFLTFERSTADFNELYLSNGSGREEANIMEVFLPISGSEAEEFGCEARDPLPCTLQGKYVPGKTFQWWAPEILKCSEPFDNLPPMPVILGKINAFTKDDIEGLEEETEEGERAR